MRVVLGSGEAPLPVFYGDLPTDDQPEPDTDPHLIPRPRTELTSARGTQAASAVNPDAALAAAPTVRLASRDDSLRWPACP